MSKKLTSIGEDCFSNNRSLKIYCEATSKPDGWNENWNRYGGIVTWGYKE